jgi:hypothetical protein
VGTTFDTAGRRRTRWTTRNREVVDLFLGPTPKTRPAQLRRLAVLLGELDDPARLALLEQLASATAPRRDVDERAAADLGCLGLVRSNDEVYGLTTAGRVVWQSIRGLAELRTDSKQ